MSAACTTAAAGLHVGTHPAREPSRSTAYNAHTASVRLVPAHPPSPSGSAPPEGICQSSHGDGPTCLPGRREGRLESPDAALLRWLAAWLTTTSVSRQQQPPHTSRALGGRERSGSSHAEAAAAAASPCLRWPHGLCSRPLRAGERHGTSAVVRRAGEISRRGHRRYTSIGLATGTRRAYRLVTDMSGVQISIASMDASCPDSQGRQNCWSSVRRYCQYVHTYTCMQGGHDGWLVGRPELLATHTTNPKAIAQATAIFARPGKVRSVAPPSRRDQRD